MAPGRPKSAAERLTTLLHLVRLGAGASFASISTRKLGESVGLSQQAASLRVLELERAGLVERVRSGRNIEIRLTENGLRTVEAFLAQASASFKRAKGELAFRGTVFSGFREGGYYISLRGYSKAFARGLGFEPFPGTLNLRLANQAMIEQRRRLGHVAGIEISGFSDGRRTYGPVKCFRATIEARHPGAVLAIERTHYDSSVLEIIAPVNLRKALGLVDGDECSVVAYV